MGCLYFFDEAVKLDNNQRVKCRPQQVEVLDNHSVPEIVIGKVGGDNEGCRAAFNDWSQFERFVEAVNELKLKTK